MSWTSLKNGIATVIKTNGNQEITGNALQGVLNAIVNSLGAHATFAGIAIPSTSPGTPDGPVFYFAFQEGSYSNFGATPFVVSEGEFGIFVWDGTIWSTLKYTPGVDLLRETVSKLEAEVDGVKTLEQSSFDINLGFITTDGEYRVTTSRNGTAKVDSTMFNRILVKANSVGATYLAFLTSDELVAGEDAPLVQGTSLITIAVNTEIETDIPQGTEYVYIYCASTNTGDLNRFPAKIELYVNSGIKKSIEELQSKDESIEQNITDIVGINFTRQNSYINLSGTWVSVGSNNCRFANISAHRGKSITINPASPYSYIAFLTGLSNFTGSAAFCNGTTITKIESTYTITIPNDAVYLYAADVLSGNNIFPSIQIEGVSSIIDERINNYKAVVDPKINALNSSVYKTITDKEVDFHDYTKRDGYIGINGNFITSTTQKYVLIPVEHYGTIRFIANSTGAFYYAFLTSNTLVVGSTAPFAQGCSLVTVAASETTDSIEIPSDARYIYVFVQASSSDRTPQAFQSYKTESWTDSIEQFSRSIESVEKAIKNNPFVFAFDFTKDFDESLIEGSYTQSNDGISLSSGFGNKIKINRYLTSVDCSLRAKIKLTGNKDASVSISSIDENRGTSHASIVVFDFSAKKIIVYPKNSGTSIPSSPYREVSFTSTADTFYIEVGRIGRNLYASVTDFYTMAKVETIIDEDTISDFKYPCGWLHDRPCLSQISGDLCYFQSFVGTTKRSDIVFLGNSITEGYGISYSKSWVSIVSETLGYCANYGRSNETVGMLQSIVDTVLSVVRPKYVVVTIGTNGDNTLENLTQLHNSILGIGAIPIFNHIYRFDSQFQRVLDTNAYIEQIGCLSARFDLATSVDNDLSKAQDTSLYQSDNIHLNQDVNNAVAERFLFDMQFLKYEYVN